MGILTVVLILMVAWTIYNFLPVILKKEVNVSKAAAKLKHIKTIGTFGLVTGILGQLVGLYSAFDLVEREGGVPFALFAGGLKVSSIATIYGILIFLFSLLIWFICDNVLTTKNK